MNDDLISRAAAIESIRKCAEVAHSNYEWDMEQGYLNAIECIEEEPSAQPERKKGCKIVKGTGHYGYCACDQCGKPVHPEDLFCSKCGADFREEDT